jgi:hypothetical protein
MATEDMELADLAVSCGSWPDSQTAGMAQGGGSDLVTYLPHKAVYLTLTMISVGSLI